MGTLVYIHPVFTQRQWRQIKRTIILIQAFEIRQNMQNSHLASTDVHVFVKVVLFF